MDPAALGRSPMSIFKHFDFVRHSLCTSRAITPVFTRQAGMKHAFTSNLLAARALVSSVISSHPGTVRNPYGSPWRDRCRT